MSGETITGNSAGINLTDPATQNPLVVTATGDVYGVVAVESTTNYAWTLENSGVIAGTAIGVDLSSGTVINGATAIIYGGDFALHMTGNVTNYGLIESRFDVGIDLSDGSILNRGLIAVASGSGIETYGTATVTNSGTIERGVYLAPGGTLINAGIITAGPLHGVALRGSDRLVLEQGSYIQGGVAIYGTNNTLELAAPTGTYSAHGFNSIAVDAGADWTLTGNDPAVAIDGSGTITNTGTLGGAVVARLEADGAFTNAAGGVIDGSVYGVATAHNVTNLGTIIGYSNGVGLGVGGTFINGSNTDTTAFVSGYYGVLVDRAAGTIANYGTVVGRSTGGVALEEGGSVTNGSTADTTASITGQRFGVGVFGAAGTVTNFATIAANGGNGAGIRLAAGGSIANQTGALISGAADGVSILGGAGTLSNAGRVVATAAGGTGVFLGSTGGEVGNTAGATISATYGLVSAGYAGLTNNGTIAGTHGGVFVSGTGVLTNGTIGATSALVSGSAYAIDTGADSVITNFGKITASAGAAIVTTSNGAVNVTVLNAGTISGSGGTAVDLAGGASRMVIDPGAVFKGAVVAQGTGNTLELAAGNKAGNISGLGSNFVGFNSVAVDPSAAWTLSGHDTLGPNAFIVTGPAGTLNVTGSVQAGSSLDLSSSGTISVGAAGTLEVGTAGGARGGSITVDAGATLIAAGTLKAAVVDQGDVVFDDGNTTTISGSLTGSGSAGIDPGTVLDVSGQLGLASISFLGNSGGATLELGTSNVVSSTISGFGPEKSIDLLHAVATSDTFLDNVLTVSGAKGVVATLKFSPGYSAANFALASDHHGGTTISFVPN